MQRVRWPALKGRAERACSHYLPMFVGFSTTCCPDPRQVVRDYLAEQLPGYFTP